MADKLPSKALEDMFRETLKYALEPLCVEEILRHFPEVKESKIDSIARYLRKGLSESRGYAEAEFGRLCSDFNLLANLNALHRDAYSKTNPKTPMKLVGFESVQMKRIEILETYKQRLLTLLQYKKKQAEDLEKEAEQRELELKKDRARLAQCSDTLDALLKTSRSVETKLY